MAQDNIYSFNEQALFTYEYSCEGLELRTTEYHGCRLLCDLKRTLSRPVHSYHSDQHCKKDRELCVIVASADGALTGCDDYNRTVLDLTCDDFLM
jgi:hypothetical protein